MKKLLTFLDNHILKFGVIATLLFIVLYPKLPSIHIIHTWVYIRLEDFVILALTGIWFIQVLRKKVKLALPLGIPIIIYWLVGLASVFYSILLIGPHLTNYFPRLVELEYLRRVEYMILFFVGFSAVRSKKDLKDFILFLFMVTAAVILYGFGQHTYPYFWKYLPQFIQHTDFCFPSFQTGNEEFAKGIPLCLPVGSRVTSTFGGHYDLAGFLIIVLPIILGVFLFAKKKLSKIFLGTLFVSGVITLILTSSRSAFLAYLFAVVVPLIFLGKKKYILPVILLSILCLGLFSESTIQRFAETFRLTTVVVNPQGQVVGTTEFGLSPTITKQLAKGKKAVQANKYQNLPAGSSFITLPQAPVATSVAVVKTNLSVKDSEKLKLANGGLELSTVQGNFSVQKALVYDISVTTRLQGEWPHAISALLSYPLLGQGYSTLTLAVDNDYLRLLGESGILGFLAFLGIFVTLGIFLRRVIPSTEDPLVLAYIMGLCGGIIGLFVNATLFDIFEASKVAEPLWLILGIGCGALALYQKKKVQFKKDFLTIFTSNISLGISLFILTLVAFFGSVGNFFVGDDFVWLKWAATSSLPEAVRYFTDAGGFFYRPLDKTLMLLFYSVFAFQPQGYHVFILFLHALMCVGVYILAKLIFKKKFLAFMSALFFLVLPIHAENIYWISSLSIDLSSVLLLFGTIQFIRFRKSTLWTRYIHFAFVVIFAVLGLFSYELALVMPLILFAADIFVTGHVTKKQLFYILPFVVLDILYLGIRIYSHAFGMGGDYSYSIPHFIPNVIGNTIGYIGLFLFGEKSLPLYTALRGHAKAFVLPLTLIIGACVVGFIVYVHKLQWKKIFFSQSPVLFCARFFVIALLPYFGLGNIAQRYGYLASVGFVIFVVWLIDRCVEKYILHKVATKKVIFATIAAILFIGWFVGIRVAQQEWTNASKITYNTLGYFKIEYPVLAHNSHIYVINRPIQYKNAWVFPVGLPEGLWFIYRDNTLEVSDILENQAQTLGSEYPHKIVIKFDQKGNISKR